MTPEREEALREAKDFVATARGRQSREWRIAESLIQAEAVAEERDKPVKVTKAPFCRYQGTEWFRCKGCHGVITVCASTGRQPYCPNCGKSLEWS